ncbi:MAG: 23S rRNA (pseudouridine(1915)-N(3))-methyltransferase RlmH [Salinivirgaceae bacterium]
MKIVLLWIGKSVGNHVKSGIDEYAKRIKRYHGFDVCEIPHIKNADKITPALLKKKEAELILAKLNSDDYVILLDENGKLRTSEAFAKQIQDLMLQSIKRVIFIIGGAYGFDAAMYNRANAKLSLSPMTFSHQLVRVLFLEQLYRANTIIKNEPYHNA